MNRISVVAFCLAIALATTLSAIAENPKIQSLCGGQPDLVSLSAELLQSAHELDRGASTQQALRTLQSSSTPDGQVRCLIGVSEFSEDLFSACRMAGLVISGTFESRGLKQMKVLCSDPRQLRSIAERKEIRGTGPCPRAFTRSGRVENQADITLRTAEGRNLFGVSGSGIRVGVLSDSLADTIAEPSPTDSSPARLPNCKANSRRNPSHRSGSRRGFGRGRGHDGTDLRSRPGCDLSFASAFTGYTEFAENIVALARDPGWECDIVVDDVIYFEEPMYQDGPIALAIEEAVATGAAYFSSAGNDADNAHERAFTDADPAQDSDSFPPTGEDLHDFGAAYGQPSKTHLQFTLLPEDELLAVLHWNEPYGGLLADGAGSEADLDLYILSDTALPMDLDANVLDAGTDFQGGIGDPFGDSVEVASYQNLTNAPRTVYLAVDHYDGKKDVVLHLLTAVWGAGTAKDKNLLRDRTIYGHGTALNAMAVAAIFYAEADYQGTIDGLPDVIDVEEYSSLGGLLPFWYTSDGRSRIDPPTRRFKPEMTAPDGTNTSFFGSDIGFDSDSDPNFFGTSAAAPHAAAVAALVLEKHPGLPPRYLYRLLQDSARDIESPGLDFWSGSGLIDAVQALTLDPSPRAPRLWTLDGYGRVRSLR
jgi:hypothetical protein